MGNTSSSIQSARLRFLQNQLNNVDLVSPSVKHDILDIKKRRCYTNLVLSGGNTGVCGSIRAYAAVGALEYLESHHYLNNIKNIAGAGYGSIFVMLFAIGYSTGEIRKIAETMDIDRSSVSSLDSDLETWGLRIHTEFQGDAGHHLMNTIATLIEKRTGYRDYTLEQLWKERGINLVISATSLTEGIPVYYTRNKYGNIPIRILIRISCSIPMIYSPVTFNEQLLVAGGLLDPTPVNQFDSNVITPYTLAIAFPDQSSPILRPITNVTQYHQTLFSTLINKGTYIKPSVWLRTIAINTDHVDREYLFQGGYRAAEEYFKCSDVVF